ncbi:unnamed protein product, partial [Effrenium voratum]
WWRGWDGDGWQWQDEGAGRRGRWQNEGDEADESRRKAARRVPEQGAWQQDFPDDEFVYGCVPLALTDLPPGQHYQEVRTQIEDLGCMIKVKKKKQPHLSRVTVKGQHARDAWKLFCDYVAHLLPGLEWRQLRPPRMKLPTEAAAGDNAKDEDEEGEDKQGNAGEADLLSEADWDPDEDNDGPAHAAASADAGPMTVQTPAEQATAPLRTQEVPLVKLTRDDCGNIRVEAAAETSMRSQPLLVVPARPAWELAQRCAQEAMTQHGLSPEPERVIKGRLWRRPEEHVLAAKISFCTACLNRGWQLRNALAINLAMCLEHLGHSVRFCVALFDSGAGGGTPAEEADFGDTVRFLKQHFSEHLRNGSLVVSAAGKQFFHSSQCKNAAHKLALVTPWETGAEAVDGWLPKIRATQPPRAPGNNRAHLLVNLDADNILSADFCKQLLSRGCGVGALLQNNSIWGFRCVGGSDSGCTGRVGCPDHAYVALGGYDEAFHPTGYQDIDFFERLKAAGTARENVRLLRFHCGWSIPNSTVAKRAKNEAKTRWTGSATKWATQNSENRQASLAALSQGRWWRNAPGGEKPRGDSACWQVIEGIGNTDPADRGMVPVRLAAVPLGAGGGTPAPAVAGPPPMPSGVSNAGHGGVPASVPDGFLPECQLRIITCGTSNLSSVLPALLKERVRDPAVVTAMQTLKSDSARHADISEEALMVCLRAVPGLMAFDGPVMFLDLRGAHDPEGDPRLRDHIGLHPQILLGVSKHPVFADSLRRVRRVVLARFVNEPMARPHITVVAYCRGGNHRSVAFGHLLWHVTSDTARQFIRCARFDVLNLTEGAGLWATPRRCGPCASCKHVNLPSRSQLQQSLQMAYQNAVSVWATQL